MTAIDIAALPWEERWNEHLGKMLYRKNLIEDPETGAEIRIFAIPRVLSIPAMSTPVRMACT